MIIDKQKEVAGIKIWDNAFKPLPELKPLCRQIAAEGSVLLKNDGVLPLKQGTKVALFGRNQEGYVKSGTGSGGLVNVEKIPVIWDSFAENGVFEVDSELVDIYKAWIAENPFDIGHGWGTQPWCQVEMPVSNDLAAKMAAKNDVAVIIIGRTAGENKDNAATKGSYMLSEEEEILIKNVTSNFEKTVVVLNVGNLIDLAFIDENNISALLYVWQGGGEGANALADVLAGKISPSGKLPDTQVYSVDCYPSLDDFGNKETLIYKEDIYVGYRYFETFAPEKVRFPFGYGLSYTTFDVQCSAEEAEGEITVKAIVKNTGDFTAKEVVQVYYGAPCGKLGTPVKQLIGFAKTGNLKAGESETLEIKFKVEQMAAYDDSGVTGNKSCYVLEQGDYTIFAGTDIRSAGEVLSYNVAETYVTQALQEAMPAETPFKRIVAKEENGKRVIAWEDAPIRTVDLEERILANRTEDIPYTGNKGIKLLDVADGKNTMEEFISQMTDEDLCAIVCGEGMNSPKVTAGTGAAFGGVCDSLLELGIPVCCVTDGPSGLRMGNEYKATSLPGGYVFSSSFDEKLIEQIFELEGIELFRYNIDALLGPGMNIHRHPLCGRNFEYFSEDPVLSGKIAAAQTRGIRGTGCTTTIKHFCGNNQELARDMANDVVSERALREIYLKGFEIAVKEGEATALMTSYNPVNGYYSASNYDLATTILRKEWGYKGFVMTDWWAKCNDKGEPGTRENLKALIRSQNDVYMVCDTATGKAHNMYEGLEQGYIVRSDLQRCAVNLLNYIMQTPTFLKYVEGGCVKPDFDDFNDDNMEVVGVIENPQVGDITEMTYGGVNLYIFELSSDTDALTQSTVTLFVDRRSTSVALSVSGTDGKIVTVKRKMRVDEKPHKLRFEFPPEVKIKKLTIKI